MFQIMQTGNLFWDRPGQTIVVLEAQLPQMGLQTKNFGWNRSGKIGMIQKQAGHTGFVIVATDSWSRTNVADRLKRVVRLPLLVRHIQRLSDGQQGHNRPKEGFPIAVVEDDIQVPARSD